MQNTERNTRTRLFTFSTVRKFRRRRFSALFPLPFITEKYHCCIHGYLLKMQESAMKERKEKFSDRKARYTF